jgi:NADH:ubiquinone oxidoreductase subunit 2 (subunit N)
MIAMLALYNVYGLSLQRCVSGCLVLLLFMSCYLITIDEVTLLNKLQDIAIVESGFISLYNLQNSVLFNNSIKNDFLGIFYKFWICFFSAIYFLVIGDSLKEQKLISFDYLVVISLAIMGLMLMCSSNDLLTSYLTMELFSLACYILASFLKSPSYAIIAGIKYFITGSVASVFFVWKLYFIFGYRFNKFFRFF